MNVEGVHPGLLLIVGALLIPFVRGKAKSVWVVAVPVIGFLNLLGLPAEGTAWTFEFLDFELVAGRFDRLSLIFGNIFSLITIIGFIFILHTDDNLEYMSGMIYAGSALGVVFAGDLFTLFIFWEMLTLCAVGLLLARRTDASRAAALRYLLMHVLGGVILLAGIVMYAVENQTVRFDHIGLDGVASWLIFIGFGINCAWPLVHAWLPDAYPEASIGGVVFMATFTTKTAVCCLARAFPGESVLLWIGMAMAIFPLFFAVLENDLRRVLAHCVINQVGFMVVGIGIGTGLALNGTAAHAYCHILYKALLFMAIGAVMYRTGTSKATELGGLFRCMPVTCILCCAGSVAIMVSGLVSKSMVMTAAAEHHHTAIWLALLFATAGVFQQAGIKLPFFAFFGRDSGRRVKEAPTNMLVAMFLAAFFCIYLSLPIAGAGYHVLYGLLPHAAEYSPYTFGHVNGQLLLLLFAALAFALMVLSGVYPSEIRSVNLDVDWFYRRGSLAFHSAMDRFLNSLNRVVQAAVVVRLVGTLNDVFVRRPGWLVIKGQLYFHALRGMDPDTLEAKERELIRDSHAGTVAIGVAGILSVVVFAVFMRL